MLAACASAQPALAPPIPPPVAPTHSSPAGRQAHTGELVYISDYLANAVYVFSYKSHALVQTLLKLHAPKGLCSNRGGLVWVANSARSELVEYAPGSKKPVLTLKDPGEPSACSVDPLTGDLAVANREDIAIYPSAQYPPKLYTDHAISDFAFCGYDRSGNLFVDGLTVSFFELAELRKGHQRFTNLALNGGAIAAPGPVQWDGKYVTVGDAKFSLIYRISVSGSQAKILAHTRIYGTDGLIQYWIAGHDVIGPEGNTGEVGFWTYPGGRYAAPLIQGLDFPYGATISQGD